MSGCLDNGGRKTDPTQLYEGNNARIKVSWTNAVHHFSIQYGKTRFKAALIANGKYLREHAQCMTKHSRADQNSSNDNS